MSKFEDAFYDELEKLAGAMVPYKAPPKAHTPKVERMGPKTKSSGFNYKPRSTSGPADAEFKAFPGQSVGSRASNPSAPKTSQFSKDFKRYKPVLAGAGLAAGAYGAYRMLKPKKKKRDEE